MKANQRLTPVCIIYVDEKRLDAAHEGALLSVRVKDRLNGIGSCVIAFDMTAHNNIIDNDGVYGHTDARQATADNGAVSNANAHLVNARAGVIHAFTEDDTSNGACFLDGLDVATNPDQQHRQWGFVYSNPAHDIFNTGDIRIPTVTEYWRNAQGELTTRVRGTYDHTFVSTAAIGGTVFWKYSDDYIKARGSRQYP